MRTAAMEALTDIDAHLKEPPCGQYTEGYNAALATMFDRVNTAEAKLGASQDERKALADECKRLWGQALHEVREGGYCPSRSERVDQSSADES